MKLIGGVFYALSTAAFVVGDKLFALANWFAPIYPRSFEHDYEDWL